MDRRLRQGEFFGDESAAFAERGKAARSLGNEGAVALQKFESLDLVREHVSAIARGGASPEVIEEMDAGRFEGIGSFALAPTLFVPSTDILNSCAAEDAFTSLRYTIPFAGSRVTE